MKNLVGGWADFRKLLLRQWYAGANYRDWPPAGFHQRPEPGQHPAGLFRCQLGQLLHRPARLQRQKVSVSGGLESRQRRSLLFASCEIRLRATRQSDLAKRFFFGERVHGGVEGRFRQCPEPNASLRRGPPEQRRASGWFWNRLSRCRLPGQFAQTRTSFLQNHFLDQKAFPSVFGL